MTADAPISDRVCVARRYARATELARDAADSRALDGYVVTAAVRDAAARLIEGLRPDSGQRAFRVTGPYGSGKSSFGLFVARLFSGNADARRLADEARVQAIEDLQTYTPLILVGRRVSFTRDLGEAVGAAARSAGRPDLARKVEGAAWSADAVLDALDALARHNATEARGGLLLLIDEMGRYVEYAAANPRTEDPSIFQRLAERAGGLGTAPLGVVAFLHQRFADYVSGLGEWVEQAWTRSAERYEEIAFHQTTEQTLYLLSRALQQQEPHARPVTAEAKALYREAGRRGLFATGARELVSLSADLYPLHPAAVVAIAVASRRFGQNERTVVGFLQSLEPHGYRRFAAETRYGPGGWYRLPRIVDYLRSQGDLRVRPSDRERRWALALDALAQADDMADLDRDLLKCVAAMAVLEPVAGLRADQDTLAWCAGCSLADAQAGLTRLIQRNLVYRRPHRDDHGLWSSSSVDLDGWLESAKAAVPPPRRINSAAALLPQIKPLVAHRHYQRTGTLRTFPVSSSWDEGGPDGLVVVVPVHPDQDEGEVLAETIERSRSAQQTAVACLHRVSPDDLRWGHELALWRWVSDNCPELRVDDLARGEVAARIRGAETELAAALAPLGRPIATDTWVVAGKVVEPRGQGGISALLSDLCDGAFPDAPILRNELINRGRLSSAVASARMVLLERMIAHGGTEHLGMTGAPPERTIYRSMLHASGIHRPNPHGGWEFGEPTDDPLNWGPAWRKLERLVGDRGLIAFDELLLELARPPLGLRAGPALVLVAAFMLANRRDIALMERGSFQPEITHSHFMRLAKTPSNFALRALGGDRSRHQLIERMAAELAIFPLGGRPEAALKPVVEQIYRWWGALPDHALTTGRLTTLARAVRHALRKGREPIDLVFDELPRACQALDGEGHIDVDLFIERLNDALLAIAGAEPLLRAAAATALAQAFQVGHLAALRRRVREEYAPHRLHLADYQSRQFIDRVLAGDEDRRLLDGVAGLLVASRLDGWRDDTLDRFAFEARALADRLDRWLSALRLASGARSDLQRIHVVNTDGTERTLVVRTGAGPAVSDEVERQLREMLEDVPDAKELLGRLLVEMIERKTEGEQA